VQTIWKGTVAFGLVSIPVRLYSATEERKVAMHQVRASDASRIRYKRVAEVDQEEVPYSEIAKGFELATGETVIITDEDLASLPVATAHTIEVLQFVDSGEIDPVAYNKSYLLEPDKTGIKPYVLLRQALSDSGKVGVVKVAIRQRESLAVLRVRDDVLVLTTVLWPDELRVPDFKVLDEDVKITKQELTIASSLIDAMTGTLDPEEHKDTYREALQALIEAKAEGLDVVAAPTAEGAGAEVVDLMEALKKSVAASKKAKSA
jgi:DNA end-binding protein Ku